MDIDVEPAIAACLDLEAELFLPPPLSSFQVLDGDIDVTQSKDCLLYTSRCV